MHYINNLCGKYQTKICMFSKFILKLIIQNKSPSTILYSAHFTVIATPSSPSFMSLDFNPPQGSDYLHTFSTI